MYCIPLISFDVIPISKTKSEPSFIFEGINTTGLTYIIDSNQKFNFTGTWYRYSNQKLITRYDNAMILHDRKKPLGIKFSLNLISRSFCNKKFKDKFLSQVLGKLYTFSDLQ